MEICTLKYIQVTSLNFRGWRDVIGCVTVGPGMCGFLYVVSNNHTSILHSYGDNEPQRYCGSDLDNAGHVTLPVTWPFVCPCGVSYRWSMMTRRLSGTVIEIFSLEDIGVTTLRFWGHVTSSVAWPFDTPWGVSYRWSMVTRRLSGTVIEIFSLKDIGVTTLTFWGHVTSSVTWPFNSSWGFSYRWSLVTMRLSCTVSEI